MVKITISNKIKLILGITSPDARWGIFAIFFAMPFSLWAFAFSFFSIYEWGGTMNPAVWLTLAIVFGVLGVVIFILSILLGNYWNKHPREDIHGERLDNIEKSINSLRNEIRQNRNERTNKGKPKPNL